VTKGTLFALIAFTAIGAQASPIVLTNAQYNTSAIALAGSDVQVDQKASPPTALNIESVVAAVDPSGDNIAVADAIAQSGRLTTSADALTASGSNLSLAIAESSVTGTVVGTGAFKLHLDFTSLENIVGTGDLFGSGLFLSLSNSLGGVLFSGLVSPGHFDLQRDIVGGTTTLLLDMISSAQTSTTASSASNFGSVTFGGTIPLPATPFLVIAGLGAMLAARRRNKVSAGA